MILRPIDSVVASYIKAQIGSSSVGSIKAGLQHLCELLRSRHVLREADRAPMEQLVIGVLYNQGRHDDKVRRWALNAIARVGRVESACEAISFTLENFSHDPQTAASAIAALFALQPDEAYSRLKRDHDFPEDLVVLAALQHAQHSTLAATNTRVNIDTATVDVLKLALVAVGLNRAPEHIFDPRYENSQIVKDLGRHDDAVVSQYSVWAITENDMLGLKDLGVPMKDIEAQPDNVRAWMHRLNVTQEKNLARNLEYLQLGASDVSVIVRSGLALGLNHVYYDELAPLVLDWHGGEDDEDCRLRLLDHIVRQADRSPSYKARALKIYREDATFERDRVRMRAHAAGHDLFGDFVRFDNRGGPSLFDSLPIAGVTNVKNVINIHGNVTGSSISQGGNATTSTSQSEFSAESITEVRRILASAQRDIHAAELDRDLKGEILAAIARGAESPTTETVGGLVGVLKRVAGIIGPAAKAAGAIASIIAAIHTFAGVAL